MIDLTVKTLDSQNHAFCLYDDQITVRGFKEHIAEAVAVPADSQRLIYCGRVLQDEKKLNDYDVNGKVIHLVQRAPPQPGQRGNDSGQNQAQGNSQNRQNPQSHYRLTRAQMHGNAMYLGAVSIPAEVMEGHGLPVVQLSTGLVARRLLTAQHMLDRIHEAIVGMRDLSCPQNPPPSESSQPPLSQPVPVPDLDAEGDLNEVVEGLAAADNDDNQMDTNQQSQSDQGSTSTADGQSNRRRSRRLSYRAPYPSMERLMRNLLAAQNRLRPFIERYYALLLADPDLHPGPGPDGVEQNQRLVDGVSECLHCLSHACHALSDIIVDMSQEPPRNLRCRPIIIQQSTILQPGIPIQVEAHINLYGRNANNNNGNEESSEGTTVGAPPEQSAETTPPEAASQPAESENTSQPSAEQQQQEPAQSPFVFNLSNNVDFLMEVSPESNMDVQPGGEQPQASETNNNNNNAAGRVNAAGVFPWDSAPTSLRNLMQAVAGYVVQGGITTTTITTRNPPVTVITQQPIVTSADSGSTNAGQSTQARSNVGTHPTTATQTRSTSRPHVFHQPPYPLGVGMAIGQGLDFDPFLPCNSHHIRRTSNAAASTAAPPTAQGTRTTQAPSQTLEPQAQAQSATTSAAASSNAAGGATGATALPPPPPNANGRNRERLQQLFDNINSNLAESFESTLQMFFGLVGDRSGNASAPATGRDLTLADVLITMGVSRDRFNIQDSNAEDSFLRNFSTFVAQNITLEGLLMLRVGEYEPIAQLRRPLQRFLLLSFPNTAGESVQERTIDTLLTQLRPYLENLVSAEEDIRRDGPRIDICATVEALLRRHMKDILKNLFDNDMDNTRFTQEMKDSVHSLGCQLCAVLRYSIRGGQEGLEDVAARYWFHQISMVENRHPAIRPLLNQGLNNFIHFFRAYSSLVPQPPDSEIIPLLVYKDTPPQSAPTPSAPTQQPAQAQPDNEPMETEVLPEKSVYAASMPEEPEEIPETFPGHDALPSEWVPIIARDSVRQRRQLQQMQGMVHGAVPPFSDAYLGAMPTKRRKVIEQQKSRLLVSPTPNHSAVVASMERLVREGVGRAGVDEVEGAAVAVAADPGVRRAFGQAIRDCLNPRRYGTPDFPDPLRFPNATKYFAEQGRSSK